MKKFDPALKKWDIHTSPDDQKINDMMKQLKEKKIEHTLTSEGLFLVHDEDENKLDMEAIP